MSEDSSVYIEANPRLTGPSPPPLVEPALETLLGQSMLRVKVAAELHRCGSWFEDEPEDDCGLFHLVGSGRCHVESPVLDSRLRLETGDLVVLAHGSPHRLSFVEDTGDAEADLTSLICGEMHFPGTTLHPLKQALPTCFVVRAGETGEVFTHLSRAMVTLVNQGQAGRQVLLHKLADTLFSLAVCHYAQHTSHQRGLFAAVADPRISKVLQAVHGQPGAAWTMQSMAALAHMSRSAYAERFTHLMQVPPMQYVTQWRVTIAEKLLLDRHQSVASIAEQLGYSSEAAFRRLFKRMTGTAPGQLRGGAAN